MMTASKKRSRQSRHTQGINERTWQNSAGQWTRKIDSE